MQNITSTQTRYYLYTATVNKYYEEQSEEKQKYLLIGLSV